MSKIRGIDSKMHNHGGWDGGADETRSLSVDIENNGQRVHDLGFLTACNLLPISSSVENGSSIRTNRELLFSFSPSDKGSQAF